MSDQLAPKQIAALVSNMLNGYGDRNGKEFVSEIMRYHPTLQQRFMGEIVIRFIREIANKNPNLFDYRNQMTKEACDTLFSTLKIENKDVGLPLI